MSVIAITSVNNTYIRHFRSVLSRPQMSGKLPTNHVKVAALLAAMCLSMSELVGCTPPYPTHKHTIAPSGIVRNLPDPSTVRPGISRCDEVLRAFREVDTGVSSRWFFWGRWESSSAAMRVMTDMGAEQVPLWSLRNFLVEFDDAGTVTKTAMLSDNRIISELERILAEHPQSAETASASVVLAGKVSPYRGHWCYGNIVVSPSTMEFSATTNGHCPSRLSLPVQGLTVGTYAAPRGEGANIAFIRLTLQSSGSTPLGSSLPVSLKANDLVLLLRFLQASRHPCC
jgi:hypothetical protein